MPSCFVIQRTGHLWRLWTECDLAIAIGDELERARKESIIFADLLEPGLIATGYARMVVLIVSCHLGQPSAPPRSRPEYGHDEADGRE